MPAARHLLASRPAAPVGPPVTGYTAWYDASQITGQADGSALASWNDLSGNSHTATQSGSGATYWSSTSGKVINGKPTVSFSGPTNLVTGAFIVNQPFTILTVMADFGNGFSVDSINRVLIGIHIASGYWGIYSGGAAYVFSSNPSPGDGLAHIETGIFNGTSSAIFIDGTQAGTGDCGSAAIGNLILGGSSTLGGVMNGLLAEVLVYPSTLNTAARQSVETYLKAKWGTP